MQSMCQSELLCLDNLTDNTEMVLTYLGCLSTSNNENCSIAIGPTSNSCLLKNYSVSMASSRREFLLIYRMQ